MNRSANPAGDTPETASDKPRPGTETEHVAQVIHDAIDRFAVHAAEAEQRVRDAAADAQDRIRSSKDAARAKTDEAASAVETYVDHHPWTALGIAFGAGVILSSLLRR